MAGQTGKFQSKCQQSKSWPIKASTAHESACVAI